MNRGAKIAIAVAIGVTVFVAFNEANGATLESCDRVTHTAHAGEAAHRDFGAGRVGYDEWWSHEGVYRDVIVADCESGKMLRTRALEERIKDRPPFDRIPAVRQLIDVEMTSSPALFSFERLADRLKGIGRDIELATLVNEPCACAVLYPDALGAKAPYEGRP